MRDIKTTKTTTRFVGQFVPRAEWETVTIPADTVVIRIPHERPISWNKYFAGRTGWQRQQESNRVSQIMMAYCPSGPMFDVPVHIRFRVGFDRRPLDPDNICLKGYIDGLKGRLIEDDTIKQVKSISVEAERSPEAYVEITVIGIFPRGGKRGLINYHAGLDGSILHCEGTRTKKEGE